MDAERESACRKLWDRLAEPVGAFVATTAEGNEAKTNFRATEKAEAASNRSPATGSPRRRSRKSASEFLPEMSASVPRSRGP